MKRHKDAYNKLKRYWKLLLKTETDLNSTDYYSFKCFKGKMTQRDVVDYLLTIDEELRDSYIFYQNLLFAIHQKKPDLFSHTLHNPPAKVSGYLQTSINSLLKYLPYVLEMMKQLITMESSKLLIIKLKLLSVLLLVIVVFIILKLVYY